MLTRVAHGAQLAIGGQALSPHARDLLRDEERADVSVRFGRRAGVGAALGAVTGTRARPCPAGSRTGAKGRKSFLDIPCEVAPHGVLSWREVLVHIVEEYYARHNGHAALLRERIDGRLGQ